MKLNVTESLVRRGRARAMALLTYLYIAVEENHEFKCAISFRSLFGNVKCRFCLIGMSFSLQEALEKYKMFIRQK